MSTKQTTLCLLLALLTTATTHAQTSKSEVMNDICKSAGVYYAYPTPEAKMTPAPKGYKPFYISLYGRHGSRWLLDEAEYTAPLNTLRKANEENKLTPYGVDILHRLQKIADDAQGRAGSITPKGVEEIRGIAERMYYNYSGAFKGNAEIECNSTVVVRCVLTMSAFSERLKELNPKLRVTRRADNRDMGYMSAYNAASKAFSSQTDGWRVDYNKFTATHISPDRVCRALFNDPNYLKEPSEAKKLFKQLYYIASNTQNTNIGLSLYDIFTNEELFDMWQCDNYKYYLCNGTAPQNNGVIVTNAQPLVDTIINQAERATRRTEQSATLRFGHDTNLMPLAGLLKLDGCYNEESDPNKFYTAWSNFKISPMAGNIQMIFYRKRNNTASKDVIVKILLNETEKFLPIDSDIAPYYKWDDVKKLYGK